MPPIERTDHLTRLEVETINPTRGQHCTECSGAGPRGRLLVFSTVYGRRARIHTGAFCSKKCHDIHHGLRPRK